uniref:class I SAM-dependent methyltransferase n=1 Tax=Streptomyces corallincola TaxID=2851888 RepID=UPI0027E33473|nr:class I SAM-dependent methyltransferase [Streptomyces corallincola]
MTERLGDDHLFAGAAPYYRRGRLPYAPGLTAALAEALGLDGRGRLLDMGCGPGTLALELAELFAEVVGVDPDAGMLTEATREAAARGLTGRVRWVRARAEQLPHDIGTFTVAAFAQSFHWMDRAAVAAATRELLRPGGVLVHVSDLKPETRSAAGLPGPPVPRDRIAELVARYLGPVRRAGRKLLPQGTPGGEREILAAAGYSGPRRLVVPGGEVLERSADDVMAGVFSLSYSAPHLFGPRLGSFEAESRALLREVSGPGVFHERQPDTEVFLWGTGVGPEA